MAKRHRIRRVIPRRILSSTIGLLLILSASICVIVFTTFSRELFRMRHDLGLSMVRALRRQIDYPTFLNPAELQRVLRSYAGTAHVDEILIVDDAFRIQASLSQRRVGALWYDHPVADLYESPDHAAAWPGKDTLTVAGVLQDGQDQLGYVAITLSTREISAVLWRAMFIIGLLVFICVVWGILFSVRLAHNISRPIETLIAGAQKIGSGDLYHTIEVKAGGEIEYLARSFNQMSVDLRHRIDELRQTTAEKERMAKEMEIAQRLQTSMLPSGPPDVMGLSIAGRSRPAKEVGGDLYDFIEVDDAHIGIVCADAAGKGLGGALFMAQSCSVVRALAAGERSPAAVLQKANNVICRSAGESGMFITFFYAVVNLDTMLVRFANAGHNPAFILSPTRDDLRQTDLTGVPLGILEDSEVEEGSLTLEPGDLMFLYSDGATDAQNENKEFYGAERLRETVLSLRQCDPDDLVAQLDQNIAEFSRHSFQFDDITLVAFRREAV